MPILNSRACPPTLKHLHFTTRKATFSIKRGFELIDALEGALEPSWARFGGPRASLGGSFGAYAASRRHPCFSKLSWGGHGTPYFTMDYGMSLACVFAISLYYLFLYFLSAYYLTLFFQIIVVHILEPLGVMSIWSSQADPLTLTNFNST